jgi:magnesium-protoporphyrin O-methyltransferase
VATHLNRGTLLDVGAGIGALTFELLEHGMRGAVAVDASAGYLAAAKEEAARRQRVDAIAFRHGDFVAIASELPVADLITLDRVVCCYQDYKSLLAEAVAHTTRGLAVSYPRDRWFVRLGVRLENGIRQLRSRSFRTFVHPVEEMQRLIKGAGFELARQSQTVGWSIDVYVRRPASAR